jgi:hypothetical protein
VPKPVFVALALLVVLENAVAQAGIPLAVAAPASAPAGLGRLAMTDATSRVFLVACATCCRALVTTARIGDPEIGILEAHLRTCRRPEPLAGAPLALGEIMRRLRVTAL